MLINNQNYLSYLALLGWAGLGWLYSKVKGVCNYEPDLSFPACSSSHGVSQESVLVVMGLNQLGGMIVQIGKFYLCSAPTLLWI